MSSGLPIFAPIMAYINFSDLILLENDNYIVVNKPADIASLDDRNTEVNILQMARAYREDIQICHRLDKGTSGALVLAKNSEAYRSASIQFERREVEKIYHALTDGIHTFKDLLIDFPLSVSGKGAVKIDKGAGKEASTLVNSLETFKLHSLLECRPATGRMHQIRVHLAAVGAPIASDETYGGRPLLLSRVKKNYRLGKFKEERPLIRRPALHARKIVFNDLDSAPVAVEAPYPKDFEVAVRQLKKHV